MDRTVIHQRDVGRTVRKRLVVQFQVGNATSAVSPAPETCGAGRYFAWVPRADLGP